MAAILSSGIHLNVREDGPRDGPVVMFSNSLGTDLRVWDLLLAYMDPGLRIVRYDKRGHGLSDCPGAPYSMQQLVDDAQTVANALQIKDMVFVGLSIGGLIGQGLAAKKPEWFRALVLMDTAAKIGTSAMWQERIAALRKSDGMASMSDAVLDRWFCDPMRGDNARLAPWRNMLERTPLEGYIGCCDAIANADFRESTAELEMPVLAMVGANDAATPPLIVEETAKLCKAELSVVDGAGHLPCVEQPQQTAALLNRFLQENVASHHSLS